jgi:hypothetical protein
MLQNVIEMIPSITQDMQFQVLYYHKYEGLGERDGSCRDLQTSICWHQLIYRY